MTERTTAHQNQSEEYQDDLEQQHFKEVLRYMPWLANKCEAFKQALIGLDAPFHYDRAIEYIRDSEFQNWQVEVRLTLTEPLPAYRLNNAGEPFVCEVPQQGSLLDEPAEIIEYELRDFANTEGEPTSYFRTDQRHLLHIDDVHRALVSDKAELTLGLSKRYRREVLGLPN